MYKVLLWIGLILLIAIAVLEIWNPKLIHEGFSNLITVGDSALWARWMPRRGDISIEASEEEGGYTRDPRYYSGYTDVQRLGKDHDFCRMIQPTGSDPTEMFFACALGGTEGLSSIKYRTPSVKDGFEISRDDYMNDVLGDGRDSYCRIIKTGPNTFETQCNPAGDFSFKDTTVVDPNPPQDIQTLLSFYEGIVFWMRFRDDMLDYAKNLTITKAGDMEIDETPRPPVTEGLTFDGQDQFLRIGDSKDLSFGNVVNLKFLRAISFWVYFEEFTNNAHIFDFGNGAGKDNVFCGIVGRGNATTQQDPTINQCMDESQKTVPEAPSGQQCVEEVSPEVAMITSSADVNQWDCPKPELFGRIMPPLEPKALPEGDAKTADLLYEIWEGKQRKLHIQVKNVIPLKKWVHIAITTANMDAFRPDVFVYQDGVKVHTENAAWLPQTNYTTNNYLGKSNWMNVTSQFDNADELFKGKMFDVRVYTIIMNEKKSKTPIDWGKQMLGIKGELETLEDEEPPV